MRKARQTRAFSILVRTLTVRNELDGFPVVELDREPFGFTEVARLELFDELAVRRAGGPSSSRQEHRMTSNK